MSAYPLMLEGAGLRALVVGGGAVATRKALALLDAGATVRVISPEISAELTDAAARDGRMQLDHRRYAPADIGDALVVIAATDDAALNAAIGGDARAAGRLVNVVSAPDAGNCATPAVHRVGNVVVAVTTGGVPNAAARLRDRIGDIVDMRYASAVQELAELRRSLLDGGDRARWTDAAASLVGDGFCADVESGMFGERVSQWR